MMIRREDTCAVVIDYQERLLPAMTDSEKLKERSGILLTGLAALEIPMIITQQYTKGLGMSDPFVFVATGTKEYIDKTEFSAMKNEQAREAIMNLDKHNVIVCGIEAHICVLQTCLDLKEEGLQPILVLDCTSARKKSDWSMTIVRAQQEGITVTTSESILFELLGKASGETFKTISKLVK